MEEFGLLKSECRPEKKPIVKNPSRGGLVGLLAQFAEEGSLKTLDNCPLKFHKEKTLN